jgi:FMN phosphatase YigB (HAD superfamily)
MSTTTILLDGGGVIVDESEMEKVRGEIIAEVLSTVVPGYDIGRYWADVDEAVRSFCPRVYEFVIWKYSKNDRMLFDELYSAHMERWKQRHPPLKLSDGFDIEAKRICQRYKMVNAGQYGREILDLLEERSLLSCFASHLTQDDFAITKPDPRYYEQIVARANVLPAECIMVGDRIDKDVIPAKQLGMKTVMIRSGIHRNQQPRVPSEIPDIELPSVRGLAEAIDRIAGSPPSGVLKNP